MQYGQQNDFLREQQPPKPPPPHHRGRGGRSHNNLAYNPHNQNHYRRNDDYARRHDQYRKMNTRKQAFMPQYGNFTKKTQDRGPLRVELVNGREEYLDASLHEALHSDKREALLHLEIITQQFLADPKFVLTC